jgi:hypothetical protein
VKSSLIRNTTFNRGRLSHFMRTLATLLLCALPLLAVEARWLRYPAISPDI